MERILNQENLELRLLDWLKGFNDEKVELSPDTVHNTVLSTTDGVKGVGSSKMQYEGLVKHALARGLIKEGKKKKEAEKAVSKIKFMPSWMNSSVKDFVSDLVGKLPALILFLLASIASFSQVQFSAGVTSTELKKAAITVGLRYVRSLDSVHKELFRANKNSVFQLSPEFNIQGGTEDAFSSVQAKITGSLITFKTNEVGGIPGADLSKLYHIFPIAAGIETNGDFKVFNGIVELGWMPVYWTETQMVPEWLKRTRFGLFVQAGYKFKGIDSALGGDMDESFEQAKNSILRLKGTFQANIVKPVRISVFRLGLVGSADWWLDLVNKVRYYKIDADLRVYQLSGDNYVSVIYQKGSGAPLFNAGSQWGIGLNVTF